MVAGEPLLGPARGPAPRTVPLHLVDVEGDLYAALSLKRHFQQLVLTGRERAGLFFDAVRLLLTPSRQEAGRWPAREHARKVLLLAGCV